MARNGSATKRPRKVPTEVVYSQDIAGLWVYIKAANGLTLITDRPIVDPGRVAEIKAIATDASSTIKAELLAEGYSAIR